MTGARGGSGQVADRMVAIFVAAIALAGVACGSEGARTVESTDRSATVASGSSDRVEAPKADSTGADAGTSDPVEDVGSALAAARDVEIPEAEVRPEFERIETLYELLETRGFVETVEATARQRSGATYRLNMRLEHRAQEPAYHMTATVERTGGQADELRRLIEMTRYSRSNLGMVLRAGGEFEQIRIGDRYWERASDEAWLSATDLPELRAFGSEPPMATLSKAVDGPNVVKNLRDPIGEADIAGRAVTHHRLEGILMFRPLWDGLGLPGAPRPPSETPATEAGPGVSDIWVTDEGLVVRAELRLQTDRGDLYEATLELTDFGEQPEIQPPG